MDGLEFRTAPLEFRADGAGVVQGVAVTYGDIAKLPGFAERFEAGAFGNVEGLDVVATTMHTPDRLLARTGGGGLELADSAERLAATIELPDTAEGRDTKALLQRGILRGLSIEFRAVEQRYEGGTRIISKADLYAVSVVDRPAYGASLADVRRAAEASRGASEGAAVSMEWLKWV